MSEQLFVNLISQLHDRKLKLAIAESLTGGLLSSSFVTVGGASSVFLGSVVAYQDSVKQALLGVSLDSLETMGAVSSQVAIEMAAGASRLFALNAKIPIEQIVSISTTGMAGPVGPNDAAQAGKPDTKPTGLVFVAVHLPQQPIECVELHLSGSRAQIRQGAAEAAANLLQKLLLRD